MSAEQVIEALRQREKQAPLTTLYRRYYDGDFPMLFASEVFRNHYEWVLQNSKENLCEAVVSSFTGNIGVQSWQGGGGKTGTDIARAFKLSKVMNLAHDEAFITGDAFVLVWPDARGVKRPYVQVSDEVYVVTEPGTNIIVWAAKLWTSFENDENGKRVLRARANIYTDKVCERYWAPNFFVQDLDKTYEDKALWPREVSSWEPYAGDGQPPVISHDMGVCPMNWLPHNQRAMGKRGRSILRNVIPLQDGLNHSLATLIVGAEAFAQPLRLILGMTEDDDQIAVMQDGVIQVVSPKTLKIDPTKESIVGIPGQGLSAVQLDPPDATKLVAVQDGFALKIARVAGLPTYYLTQTSGDVPSGQALRVLRERMSTEVTDFEEDVAGTWSDIMALLGAPDCHPEWKEASPLDPVERAQIAQIKKNIGYPFEELLIDFGETPEDIQRILQKKQDEQDRQQELFANQQLNGLRLLQGNDSGGQ